MTYIAACSVNAQTAPAVLDIQLDVLETVPNQSTVGPATSSWSVWSPGDATNFSVAIASALWGAALDDDDLFYQGYFASEFSTMDEYIMSLLGLNETYALAASVSQSSADPTVTLSPQQLENAIAQTAANLLWVAGQLGENWGGFQRSVGESQAINNAIQFRLHLNTVPVVVASIAVFSSLALATLIIGKPSEKREALVTGTSVLECLWLEAHSESLHAHMETVDDPQPDRLRVAGMFDICLGNVGWSKANQPILESAGH